MHPSTVGRARDGQSRAPGVGSARAAATESVSHPHCLSPTADPHTPTSHFAQESPSDLHSATFVAVGDVIDGAPVCAAVEATSPTHVSPSLHRLAVRKFPSCCPGSPTHHPPPSSFPELQPSPRPDSFEAMARSWFRAGALWPPSAASWSASTNWCGVTFVPSDRGRGWLSEAGSE